MNEFYLTNGVAEPTMEKRAMFARMFGRAIAPGVGKAVREGANTFSRSASKGMADIVRDAERAAHRATKYNNAGSIKGIAKGTTPFPALTTTVPHVSGGAVPLEIMPPAVVGRGLPKPGTLPPGFNGIPAPFGRGVSGRSILPRRGIPADKVFPAGGGHMPPAVGGGHMPPAAGGSMLPATTGGAAPRGPKPMLDAHATTVEPHRLGMNGSQLPAGVNGQVVPVGQPMSMPSAGRGAKPMIDAEATVINAPTAAPAPTLPTKPALAAPAAPAPVTQAASPLPTGPAAAPQNFFQRNSTALGAGVGGLAVGEWDGHGRGRNAMIDRYQNLGFFDRLGLAFSPGSLNQGRASWYGA